MTKEAALAALDAARCVYESALDAAAAALAALDPASVDARTKAIDAYLAAFRAYFIYDAAVAATLAIAAKETT